MAKIKKMKSDGSIADLVEELKREHTCVEALAQDFVRKAGPHAYRAGCVLLKIKERVPHGQFENQVKNCGIAPRTAQGYMQYAQYLNGLPLKERRAELSSGKGLWKTLEESATKAQPALEDSGAVKTIPVETTQVPQQERTVTATENSAQEQPIKVKLIRKAAPADKPLQLGWHITPEMQTREALNLLRSKVASLRSMYVNTNSRELHELFNRIDAMIEELLQKVRPKP
jgi:hypothetical protein